MSSVTLQPSRGKQKFCFVLFLHFLIYPPSFIRWLPFAILVVIILMQVLFLRVYLLNILWLLEMHYGLELDVWTWNMMSCWLGHMRLPFSPSLCFVGTWGSRYPETVFIWFSPVSIEIWCPFPVSLTITYLCRQNRDPHFTQEQTEFQRVRWLSQTVKWLRAQVSGFQLREFLLYTAFRMMVWVVA